MHLMHAKRNKHLNPLTTHMLPHTLNPSLVLLNYNRIRDVERELSQLQLQVGGWPCWDVHGAVEGAIVRPCPCV